MTRLLRSFAFGLFIALLGGGMIYFGMNGWPAFGPWGIALVFFGILAAIVAWRGGRLRLTATSNGPDGIGGFDQSTSDSAHGSDASSSFGDGAGDGH